MERALVLVVVMLVAMAEWCCLRYWKVFRAWGFNRFAIDILKFLGFFFFFSFDSSSLSLSPAFYFSLLCFAFYSLWVFGVPFISDEGFGFFNYSFNKIFLIFQNWINMIKKKCAP